MNYWAVKLSLFINYFVIAILINSVGTVILQVQNAYGISESSAGVLEAFKDLSIAFTSFLVGSFVVRVGYKKCMLFALSFISIICLLMPYVPAFWMTKLMFATVGISFALIKVSVFATLGLVTKNSREHVSLMNFLESFFMVGVLCGYFIFSAFVDDKNPGSSEWLNVYYVLAILSTSAFILLLFTTLDESSVKPDKPGSLISDFADMMSLCLKPLVVVFVVSAFLYVLIEQSIMSWLPTFNSTILNLPVSLSIQMASILAGSTALGRLIAGFLFVRVDWFKVLCAGLLSAAVLVLIVMPLAGQADSAVISNWGDAPLAAFVFPLIGICIAPVYPAINSVILSALPVRQQALMAGLIVIFSALGGTTGSIVTGHLFEAFDGKIAFYFSLLPLSVLLFFLYLLKRRSGNCATTQPQSPVPASTY